MNLFVLFKYTHNIEFSRWSLICYKMSDYIPKPFYSSIIFRLFLTSCTLNSLAWMLTVIKIHFYCLICKVFKNIGKLKYFVTQVIVSIRLALLFDQKISP